MDKFRCYIKLMSKTIKHKLQYINILIILLLFLTQHSPRATMTHPWSCQTGYRSNQADRETGSILTNQIKRDKSIRTTDSTTKRWNPRHFVSTTTNVQESYLTLSQIINWPFLQSQKRPILPMKCCLVWTKSCETTRKYGTESNTLVDQYLTLSSFRKVAISR